MELTTFLKLIFITLGFFTIIVFRIIIGKFMDSWDQKIESFVKGIDKDDDPIISPKTKYESKEQILLIAKRKKGLGFITTTVAWIELAVFMILTLLIFYDGNPSILEKAKIFGAFLGGWMAIKILSSHGPWSDKVVGKAYYHQSLIGTLLNILGGFISGVFISIALFSI